MVSLGGIHPSLERRVFWKTTILFALLGALWFNQHEGFIAQQKRTCDAVNMSNAALVSYIGHQLDRAETTLPTLSYYKSHPRELRQQIRLIESQRADTLSAFPQISC